jgi:hypothetical protein
MDSVTTKAATLYDFIYCAKSFSWFRVEINSPQNHHAWDHCMCSLSHSLSPFQFTAGRPAAQREKKDQKSNGNDSKQLDVIISETLAAGGGCGMAMRCADTYGQRQSLLLRAGRKREEEKGELGKE